MASKPDFSVWDGLAAQGFFFHTDPKQPGGGDVNIVEDPEEAIEARKKADVVDKIVSSILDTPVSISAKAGDLTGRGAQWAADKARSGIEKVGKLPGIDTLDDGLKALDKSGTLDSLSKGQLPGNEAVANFLNDGVSRIEKIKGAPWIGKLMAFPATAVSYPLKGIMPESWDKVVDGITLQLTRDLLTEMADILIQWYQDPKTLCCLIKNLAALGSMLREQDFSSENWDQEKQKFFSGVRSEDYLGDDYFRTRKILINIKEYLDIIIEVLSLDFSRDMFASFDIGKEMADMLVGLMIAIMEAMIASGKKAWYDKVQEWFKDLNQLDLQCLPLNKMVDALFRFMSDDHGLFSLLRRYTDEYARYLKFRFINNFKKKYISRTKDIQFLKFLRDLIEKIIASLDAYEICVEDDYSITTTNNPLSNFDVNKDMCPYGVSSKVTNTWQDCPYRTFTNNDITCRVTEQVPNTNGRTSYCIHPEAIADYFGNQRYGDQGNLGKIKGALPGTDPTNRVGDREEVAITFPTDNEMRNFFINRLGYSSSQADQILAESQVSKSEGKIEMGLESLSDLGLKDSSRKTLDGRTIDVNKDLVDKRAELMSALGDCAKTLNPKTIADLANRLTDIL